LPIIGCRSNKVASIVTTRNIESSVSSSTPRSDKYKYNIAVVPGDGIGPEVCGAAVRVLEVTLGADFSRLVCTTHEAGAECYRRTGVAFPDDTLAACRDADAILHGAAGLPGVLYADGTEAGQDFTLRLRAELDLYANVRPIKLYEGVPSPLAGRRAGDIDYVIVRENTEGLYASRGGGTLIGDSVATDTMVITRKGVERVVRFAAELARRRKGPPRDGKRRVTIVDKSNVLRSFAFFRHVAESVLDAYPDVEIDYALTDAMSTYLVSDPDYYDVIVTENFVGDLLSDLGAATVGSLGMGASAELGDSHGYFQSSHGTAPTIAGKGIANPIASILSGAFMLDWLGERREDATLQSAGARIQQAVSDMLASGQGLTRDLGGSAGTNECTDAICRALTKG
jgi:3-isopropylmalate dehydrogenase